MNTWEDNFQLQNCH